MGRADEVRRLTALLDDARRGTGAAVVITGRAGLGKSRLLHEFMNEARGLGAFVISATADRGPVLRPHDLMLGLLASAIIELQRSGDHAPQVVRDALIQFESGGDDLGRASSLTAFVTALLALPRRPVLVVADDVHWADEASAEVLRSLAGYAASIPVVVVRAQRPDPSTVRAESRLTATMDLAPLSAEDIADLLVDTQHLDRVDAAQAALTVMQLGGDVPAVLEHVVNTAGGTGRDGFTLGLSHLRAADPAEVMALRLASLAPWTREVLSVAAVLGRDVDVASLEALLGDSGDAGLAAALDEACDRGVLVARSPGRFRFTHPLGPEVLYERLGQWRRAELHARAAEALVAAGPQHAVGVAHHTLAAARLDARSVGLIVSGGDTALQRSAFAEAAQLYAAALQHGLEGDERVRVLLAQGQALRGVGRRQEARECFETVVAEALEPMQLPCAVEAAISHAEGGDFRVGAKESAHLIERVLARSGLSDVQRARLVAGQARVSARVDRVVKEIDVDDLFAVGPLTLQDRVQWSYAVRANHAHELSESAVRLAETSGDDVALLQSLAAWRSVHRSPHVLAERTERGLRAVELADRLGRRAEGVELRGWLAVDHLERGDRRAFDVVAHQVDATMGRFGNHPLHWLAACLRTLAEQLDGRPRAIAEAATAAAKVDVEFEVPGRWTSLAILLWRAGELADDRSFARSLSSKHPDIFDQAAAAAMLGISRAREGHHDEAHELLDRALQRLRLHEVEISWLLSLHAVADLAAELEAAECAPELLDLMQPWLDRNTIGNHGTVMLGPMARPVARLRALLGAPDAEVGSAFAQSRALCESLRAPAFAAETALDEARWHASRAALDDAARCARYAVRLATPLGAVWVRRCGEQLLEELPVEGEPWAELTARQWNVLSLMADGLSNPEIARRLAFSLSTVAKETSDIYRRLDVVGRQAAVRVYRRQSRVSAQG